MGPTANSSDLVCPVILSGGAGTRLWPMSRALYPKQFAPLLGSVSLLQQTARRVSDPNRYSAPLVICNEKLEFVIAEQLSSIDVEPDQVVLEPVGRNTAPAAAVAALLLSAVDPQALMLVLPSDHVVRDVPGFSDAVDVGAQAARSGALVTFGIKPDRPETGFGYLRRGDLLDGATGCYRVEEFIEKPDVGAAERYIAADNTYWNSGIFLFAAGRFLEELDRLQPEIVAACRAALDGAAKDDGRIRLDAKPFAGAPSISIDYSVMEHTDTAAVVPVDFGWSDLGSWSALWTVNDKDDDGNVLLGGNTIAEGTKNSYLHTTGPLIAAVDVEDLVVVATDDAVLVVPRISSQRVKQVVDRLSDDGRVEHEAHTVVHRPWGSFQGIDLGERHQVKRIVVKPGAALSLQMHHHRAEHWVVVRGTAKVTRGDDVFLLQENESTYIPFGVKHRLQNPGKIPLEIIEIQSGSYFGEDDIVRFEDVYGRKEKPK